MYTAWFKEIIWLKINVKLQICIIKDKNSSQLGDMNLKGEKSLIQNFVTWVEVYSISILISQDLNPASFYWYKIENRIGGVMVSMLASSAVDCGFEPRSGQTKDYKIGICCFSAKHTALMRKSKDCLVRNQDNVSEWGNMFIRGLLFQWASTIKIQLSVLV
jgi:hypothetical protein